MPDRTVLDELRENENKVRFQIYKKNNPNDTMYYQIGEIVSSPEEITKNMTVQDVIDRVLPLVKISFKLPDISRIHFELNRREMKNNKLFFDPSHYLMLPCYIQVLVRDY